jgi:hypothetical protein
MLKRLLAVTGLLTLLGLFGIRGAPAYAMLSPGQDAPDIAGPSVIDGKAEAFTLKSTAARRPVVLYFFVKAFTSG